MTSSLSDPTPYIQKSRVSGDLISANFLDFPQNFRLRTRHQYCTTGNGQQRCPFPSFRFDSNHPEINSRHLGNTIFVTFFCQLVEFYDLRTFVAIYILSRFTHFFPQIFFGQNSHLRNKSPFLDVWLQRTCPTGASS